METCISHHISKMSFWAEWLQSNSYNVLVVSTITLLTLIWILSLFLTKNPSLPPGPSGLPLVGSFLSLDPELHTYFTSLAQTYGPIFTLKLCRKTWIIVNSSSLAKEVLKDQDTTFANRDVPLAAKGVTYGGLDIAWNQYGPQWRMMRRVCARETLGGHALDSVYSLRRRAVREMIRFLYNQRGSQVDFGEQMFLTLLNVITSMMWGGTVVREGLGAEIKEVIGELIGLVGMPNLSDFYPVLERFDLQGIQKKIKRVAKRMDQIFQGVIDQRLKSNGIQGDNEGKETGDFLQFLLEMKEDEDAKTLFTMDHLKALLLDMVVGGTDTTAHALEFAMAEMMNKPEILSKVQQELEAAVGKGNIVEESDIKNLPYLSAVMKEAMRLHPTLPLLIPHCPSKVCSMGGYTIPKGARVFVNVWAIHRDPSIWENPLEFCPERFLDGRWDFSGNDFGYIPFGSGRRICVGIGMAERMFMFSFASLVHSFDWSLPAGEKLDTSEKFRIVLRKRTPLIVIPTPRLSDPTLYE